MSQHLAGDALDDLFLPLIITSTITSTTPTLITLQDDENANNTAHVIGTGLTVDAFGNMTGGTITGFKVFHNGVLAIEIDGLSELATTFQAAIAAIESIGDGSLLEAIFDNYDYNYNASNVTNGPAANNRNTATAWESNSGRPGMADVETSAIAVAR